VTARFCDLDHVRPWPHGPTALDNLMLLCRRHHRVKQRPGWAAVLAPDGSVTWRTPDGRVLTTRPVDHLEPVRLAPSARAEVAGGAGDGEVAGGAGDGEVVGGAGDAEAARGAGDAEAARGAGFQPAGWGCPEPNGGPDPDRTGAHHHDDMGLSGAGTEPGQDDDEPSSWLEHHLGIRGQHEVLRRRRPLSRERSTPRPRPGNGPTAAPADELARGAGTRTAVPGAETACRVDVRTVFRRLHLAHWEPCSAESGSRDDPAPPF
jgi:hypothetical protein